MRNFGHLIRIEYNGVFHPSLKRSLNSRASTKGKTGKTKVLPGFCGIEHGGGTPVMWMPLWGSCLPKIERGGPESLILFYAVHHRQINQNMLYAIEN